jgi:hypothetical protein
MSKSSGDYVLANNVDANGITLEHKGIARSNTVNVFQGVLDGRGFAIYNFMPKDGGLLGSVYSDTKEEGGKSVIKDLAFINVQSKREQSFSILGQFVASPKNGVRTEVTNLHVEIAKTELSAYDPTPNYKGIFGNNVVNDNVYDTFKMTNVYLNVLEEEYTTAIPVSGSSGSIITRDHAVATSKIDRANRSSRYQNVVTITKMNPTVYRQYKPAPNNNELFTEFGMYMYFMYSVTDIGKAGLTFTDAGKLLVSPHPVIEENANNGSFILDNVYRYDTITEITAEQKQAFKDTGLWQEVEGELKWTNRAPEKMPDAEEGNFDVDWL